MRAGVTIVASVALGAALLSGCSFQTTLDKLVPRERQAELVSVSGTLCSDPVAVTPELHAEIANSVREAAAKIPAECPGQGASWRLASYQVSANVQNGQSQRQEEAVVIGKGSEKWTTVTLRYYAENGAPMKIVAWNVLGSATKPEALTFVENFDRMARIMSVAVPAILLAIAALAGWLIVRWRRKKRA